MRCVSRPSRGGFTLIEVLMVLTILAMLGALVTPAIFKAVRTAKVARIVMEIGQLDDALQAYKEKHYRYPPCLGDADPVVRVNRFSQQVRIAWPRCTISYATLRTNMRTKRDVNADHYDYTYMDADGALQHLDLDTMDQAEAMVFWLGGFPTPWDSRTTTAIAPRKLFGFHVDPTNPFKRDPRAQEEARPLNYRTPPLFQFDETRLVDLDGDGWLEYIPPGDVGAGLGTMPPYVYFDNGTYNNTGASGTITHTSYPPPMSPLLTEWGMAVPYATFFDPEGKSPARWVNPDKFQIICAGFDAQYGAPRAVGGNGPPRMRVPVYPHGATYHESDSYGKAAYYDAQELDNLTNFATRSLEDARETN